jgi:hypothetical protein
VVAAVIPEHLQCEAIAAHGERCRKPGERRSGCRLTCAAHEQHGYIPHNVKGEDRAVERAAAVLEDSRLMTPELSRQVRNRRLQRGATVRFSELSANRKMSPVVVANGKLRSVRPYVSSTFASIRATCPDSCRFKPGPAGEDRGCYAAAGITRTWSARFDLVDATGLEVNEEEAREIDRAFCGRRVPQDGPDGGGRALRLHVGGDVEGPAGLAVLVEAVRRWLARGGGPAWTYTHRWREIPSSSWGPIAVLASCETAAEVLEARRLGYSAALVIDSHEGTRARKIGAWRFLPCPAETKDKVTCATCGLCMKDLVKLRLVILFQAHGPTPSRKAARQSLRLPVLP